MPKPEVMVETLVHLADTLVDDYDVVDFLQELAERCVDVLAISEAGIMLADSEGTLRYMACSSERMRLVELFELQIEEGPCFDAFRTRAAVSSTSPEDARQRWPRFAPHAHEAGFDSVAAVPMRLRAEVIGALNLFSRTGDAMSEVDLRFAQAMADVATIGILSERAIRDSRALAGQLEMALESRIVIEQAKGIVAAHNHITVDEAFELIRRYARDHNRLLSEVAREIVTQVLTPECLAVHRKASKRPR